MKISSQSQSEIYDALKRVCVQYEDIAEESITDFYVEVRMDSGELCVLDDEDRVVSEVTVGEFANHKDEDPELLNAQIARDIRKELERLDNAGEIGKMRVMKPFSFVLVDEEKEVIEDLYLVDDENVVIGSDLMAGLDDELDEFIEKLLDGDE